MSFYAPSMLIDRVDDHDRVIGRIERRSVFERRANFRVVHVLVRNQAGDVLVQQIAPGLRHAGAWGSSAAGYLKAGESYDQAASRKLSEELGIASAALTSHGQTCMIDNGCKKFIGVYSVRWFGEVAISAGTASTTMFLSLADIRDALRTGCRTFTATFAHVLSYLALDGGRG